MTLSFPAICLILDSADTSLVSASQTEISLAPLGSTKLNLTMCKLNYRHYGITFISFGRSNFWNAYPINVGIFERPRGVECRIENLVRLRLQLDIVLYKNPSFICSPRFAAI